MHRPRIRHDARNTALSTTRAAPNYSTVEIVASFNTWAFKREKPSDPVLLEAAVATAVLRGAPIPFVLYWGKGPRQTVCDAEPTCLAYLTSMARRIDEKYAPGAVFDIVFTDTHARLNGHSERAVQAYFRSVEHIADPILFRSHRLSEVVAYLGGEPPMAEQPDDETLEKLQRCAAKWFRGEGSPEEGARRYFSMNMVEKRAIEKAFPKSIFVTFNGSEYRCLFPETMPIFYMYSMKKGFAVKPWFIPDRPASP